jgi:hypothetical protein
MTDAQLDEFDPLAERVRQQLRTFPLKFRELGEGGKLSQILTDGETQTLPGPYVGQQPEMFTEQYLIEPVLHGLGYINPASTEYDGTGPHFVRRPTTFRSVESKRPDYLLKQVDPRLVCILEAKAANKEQKTKRAATSDIREYIEVNAFCKYLREMEHEQMVAIGTDGLHWALWHSHLRKDTQEQVCWIDLTEVLRAISRRLGVIEGQTNYSANDVRNHIERFVDHFAVNRLPRVIDETQSLS